MTLIGVVLNNLTMSDCMSINAITYNEFTNMLPNYTSAALVEQISNNSYRFIDMLKLKREQPLAYSTGNVVAPVDSWNQLQIYLNNLGSDIVQKYYTKAIVPKHWLTETILNNTKIDKKYELTPFHSNITNQLKIVSIENTIGFDVEYCDHNDFYERRKWGYTWNYPDISIIDKGSTNSVNFSNSIPIVNGIVFYPEVRRNEETGYNELIAHEAGKWLVHSDWNQAYVKTVKHRKVYKNGKRINDPYDGGEAPTESAYCYNKGILLMDFSSFGDISIIKLSDCTNGKINYIDVDGNEAFDSKSISERTIKEKIKNIHTAYIKGTFNQPYSSKYRITFDLPLGTELGVPIVCIAGRMFYLNEDSQISVSDQKISLTVMIDRSLLQNIILTNLQGFGKQNIDTSIVEERLNVTLKELFKDTSFTHEQPEDINRILNEDATIPFVIMVHSHKAIISTKTNPIMTLGPDKFLFPPNAGGLLVNKRTREIVDYVRQFYDSSTLIVTSQLRPINFIYRDYKQLSNNPVAFEFNKYIDKSKYRKFDYCYEEGRDLDEYVLIDFAFMEN